MRDDESGNESFEDMIRSFVRELGRSAERMTQFDVDEVAEAVGIDPERAREWADSASRWLRDQFENLGDDLAGRAGGWSGGDPRPRDPRAWSGEEPPAADDPRLSEPRMPPRPGPPPAPADATRRDDPFRGAAPHPLDLPSEEQGVALAALQSGRWIVEPGSHTLSSRGDGPGPRNALGLVRELHARDWIDGEGTVTPVGRHALERWLETTNR